MIDYNLNLYHLKIVIEKYHWHLTIKKLNLLLKIKSKHFLLIKNTYIDFQTNNEEFTGGLQKNS